MFLLPGLPSKKHTLDVVRHRQSKRQKADGADSNPDAEFEVLAKQSMPGGSECNLIYKDPSTGGLLFVGTQKFADHATMLTAARIKLVVNCKHLQFSSGAAARGDAEWMNWPVGAWRHQGLEATPAAVMNWCEPVMKAIKAHLDSGRAVLLHCEVGRHRSAAAATVMLMYLCGCTQEQAIRELLRRRPVCEPRKSSRLREFLDLVEVALCRYHSG